MSAWILHWLARFPLLGEDHLQALIGCDERSMARHLAVLRAHDLIGTVTPDSPEFACPQRLYHLTAMGAAATADAVGMSLVELAKRLPVGRSELLARLVRVETVVAVAGFVAALAEELRGEDEAGLEDAWGTHWASSAGLPTVPPLVEACVRVHAGSASASFLLAWDRAGAPAAHRIRRIAAWSRADEERDAAWGPSLRAILVVCPDERTASHWAFAVQRSAARRGRPALPLSLTLTSEVAAYGPLHAHWRQLGERRATGLLDRLAWRTGPLACQGRPAPRIAVSRPTSAAPATPPQAEKRLGTGYRSVTQATPGRSGPRPSRRERWATLAIELSAAQKRLLEWIGHHPLLPAAHLTVHADLPRRSVTTLLGDLVRRDLVVTDALSGGSGTVAERYVLTADGAAFLAARDGVSPRLYLREGVIVAEGGAPRATDDRGRNTPAPVRLAHLRRHPEHTFGVQRFALALAHEAVRQRALGDECHLLAWLNDAEAQLWFRHGGRVHHIWPDARLWYRADGVVYDLLLEWDRGLVRRRDYARKFAAYAAYFNAHPVRQEDYLYLIVVTTATAASRVRAAVVAASHACAQLAAVTWVITQEAVGFDQLNAAPADRLAMSQSGRTLMRPHRVGGLGTAGPVAPVHRRNVRQ